MNLFLDLETIGLPIRNANYKDLKAYNNARVVQIAIALYDDKGICVSSHSSIIKPNGFLIANSDIHGIAHDTAIKDGVDFKDIIPIIKTYISNACLLIAHNINFDKPILLNELYRCKEYDLIQKIESLHTFCTCIETTNILKLKNKYGSGYKYPKLSELHQFLFRTIPINMHNAKYDVEITARCFYELIAKGYFELE